MDEQMQQLIVLLVQAAMQGDQQAQQQVQQIMQAAQLGDQQAQQIAQVILAVVLQMQGAQMARFGAKLNYLKFLRGKCPEGYEMQYFKAGGKTVKTGCKKCQKAAQKAAEGNVIEEFKCGRKMKKKAQGGNVDAAKCGKKIKKGYQGIKTSEKNSLDGPYYEVTTPRKVNTSDGSYFYNETSLYPINSTKVTDGNNTKLIQYLSLDLPYIKGYEYPNGKNEYFMREFVTESGDGYAPITKEAYDKVKKIKRKANGGTIDIFAPYRNFSFKKKELINFNKRGNKLIQKGDDGIKTRSKIVQGQKGMMRGPELKVYYNIYPDSSNENIWYGRTAAYDVFGDDLSFRNFGYNVSNQLLDEYLTESGETRSKDSRRNAYFYGLKKYPYNATDVEYNLPTHPYQNDWSEEELSSWRELFDAFDETGDFYDPETKMWYRPR